MADVQLTANLQPAPACYPPDINTLLELIAGGGITASISDSLIGGAYRGTTPPASSLTNPIWFVVDGAGRPLGIKLFYNGNWRPVPNGTYGDIKMFNGSVSEFDGSGRGVIGGWHDGWALCNGQNGTPDLRSRFIAGGVWGATNDGTNATTWVTDIDSQYWRYQGGSKGPRIAASNLPALMADIGAAGGRWQTGSAGDWIYIPPYGPGVVEEPYAWPLQVTDTSRNPTGAANPITPAFYALAFIMYVGYQ